VAEKDVQSGQGEVSSETFAQIRQRYTSLRLSQPRWTREPPAERWQRAARELAGSVDPERVCVEPITRAQLEHRLIAALGEAQAQAGDAGAELFLSGIERLGARLGSGQLLHGTGSWALSGILRDGALVPGGDGLTGEVALTAIVQPDLFVCLSTGPLSMYAAAAFAYSNCGLSTPRLVLSAERAGMRSIAEFFSVLVFAEQARFTPSSAELVHWLVRHRTAAMDQSLGAACDRALELAASARLAGDGAGATRRLAPPTDRDAAFDNVLAAVVASMNAVPELMRIPAERRLGAGVLALCPVLKSRLLCPLPGDDADEHCRKAAVLAALSEQFPCVLTLDQQGVECRADPGYPWTDERLVRHRIGADRIATLHAPLEHHEKLRTALVRCGLGQAELLPLEDIESLRLLGEAG
jgi:hypothetical protein